MKQKYENDKYENIPHKINVTPKDKGRLTIDELWSFIKKINNGYGLP